MLIIDKVQDRLGQGQEQFSHDYVATFFYYFKMVI